MRSTLELTTARIRAWIAVRRTARRLRAQLPLVVSVLAAYVRAGRSLRQAVADTAGEAPEPSGRALRDAAAAIALGASPAEALGALGTDTDVTHLRAVVEMQTRAGGDLALLLDRFADVLRGREELRRAAAVATAQARATGRMVTAMPAFGVAARPPGFHARGREPAGLGGARAVGRPRRARTRADRADRCGRSMSAWELLCAAALFGLDAVRAYRREPRTGTGRRRRAALGWMAAIGRRPASHLPAALAHPPDPAAIRRAGDQVSAADVVAARVTSAVGFGMIGLAGAVTVGGAPGVVAGIVLAGFGCAYPDLWLRSAGKRRAARIERAAPALLELVAAAVAAGIPLDAAVAGAAHAAGGELADELERSRVSRALGRPRGEELRDLSERTGAPTLAALGLALRLSDRLGVPLAESLRGQAARSRAVAARNVQERAARAGPRVLAVVVFVLVPAALLPIGAAVALTIAGSLAAHT